MGNGILKGALLSTLVIASLIVPVILLSSPSPVHASLIPHAPILIDGNADFTKPDPVNGGGSGTENDPYIIENWDIDASSANGIEIRNTTAHFIIRNCYVHDGRGNGCIGLSFENVRNGKISNVVSNNNSRGIYLGHSNNNELENNTFSNNHHTGIYLYYSSNDNILNCSISNNAGSGIDIYYSSNVTIENNFITNNGKGIFLWYSPNNFISNNSIENSEHEGFYLKFSSSNTLRGNILSNGTWNFGVYGWDISYFHQDIDTSNTINGKPIYYVVGGENLTFDGSVNIGYLGLVSCRNIRVENININKNGQGLLLADSTSSTISGSVFLNNLYGVLLYESSNISIENNSIESSKYGIYLEFSGHNSISNNFIRNNSFHGIRFWYSSYNSISNNSIEGNYYGIFLQVSKNNTLRGNIILNNTLNFSVGGVGGVVDHHFHQDIDISNTINGKPIYYIVGEENLVFEDIEVGYLGLVACRNIRVENITVTNNGQGILLADTSCSTIFDSVFSNCQYGLLFSEASSNSISNNFIRNNEYGIRLADSSDNNFISNNFIQNHNECGIDLDYYSNNNFISNNSIQNNARGIYFWHSSNNNSIVGNSIQNNWWYGIYLERSSNNSIYHNNIVNNATQAYDDGSNYWDDGHPSGGNYWSDYTGSDANGDGIGDTSYSVHGGANQDRYPLMNPWTPLPPAPPVGGIVAPVNKLALLAPWIILATIITIATVSVAVYWRRR